jgi:uncharacterized protein YkvS
MTKAELTNLMHQPYCPRIYVDREELTATISGAYGTRTVNVPIGTPGFIENVNENSITVRWDYYYFENHTIYELLLNPISVLDFEHLGLVRTNKYPPNVHLI